MFVKYQFIDRDKNIPNTIYLSIDDIEVNSSLRSCVIHMPNGFSAFIYESDIDIFLSAFERNDHVFDFNQLADSAEFFNKYGDQLERYTGEFQ